jgi:hypothetical protein
VRAKADAAPPHPPHPLQLHEFSGEPLVFGSSAIAKRAARTDVTQSSAPRSQSLVTLEVQADHKYTQGPSPTASTFSADLEKKKEAGERSR